MLSDLILISPAGNEMNEIMQNFEAKGLPGFPRIMGVIYGTHIDIRAPTRQPHAYVNRKKFHSLVTQASAMSLSFLTLNEKKYLQG